MVDRLSIHIHRRISFVRLSFNEHRSFSLEKFSSLQCSNSNNNFLRKKPTPISLSSPGRRSFLFDDKNEGVIDKYTMSDIDETERKRTNIIAVTCRYTNGTNREREKVHIDESSMHNQRKSTNISSSPFSLPLRKKVHHAIV